MQVNVTGFSQKKTADLKRAAIFFADQLMDPRMVRNITLDIERNSKLDVIGECVDEDDVRNPRWFTITLRDKIGEEEDIIKTLAHEMVHVKQYAKNELARQMRVTRGNGFKLATKWKGELWMPKRKEDAYWDAPWEIEAYGREVGLYHKWVEHNER